MVDVIKVDWVEYMADWTLAVTETMGWEVIDMDWFSEVVSVIFGCVEVSVEASGCEKVKFSWFVGKIEDTGWRYNVVDVMGSEASVNWVIYVEDAMGCVEEAADVLGWEVFEVDKALAVIDKVDCLFNEADARAWVAFVV